MNFPQRRRSPRRTAPGQARSAKATRRRPDRRPTRVSVVVGVAVLLAAVITAATPGWTTYTIKRGDTLTAIAKRYGTSVGRLVRVNDLPGSSAIIYAGDKLRVPAPARRPAAATVRHRIRPGETVSGIAVRYGTTTRAIIQLNGLTRAGHIRAGDLLRVPAQARARTTPASANTFAGRTYPARTVNAAARNRAILEGRPGPSRAYVRALIVRTAARHGVDPALALAISWQESGWNQRRVSVANAIGAMQVIPASGDWASSIIGRRLDLLDVEDNVTAGVVLLRVLTRAAGSERRAIASYYQGLTSVRRNGMFADTKVYVRNVQYLKRRFD